VTTPPKLTREQYEDFLDEKSIKQDYLAFLDGRPVLTTGGLPFILSCLLQIDLFFIFIFFNLDSPLAIALKAPCNVFATSVPEKFTAITEITSLSLPYSNLTSLPESLGLLFLLNLFFCPFLIVLPF